MEFGMIMYHTHIRKFFRYLLKLQITNMAVWNNEVMSDIWRTENL